MSIPINPFTVLKWFKMLNLANEKTKTIIIPLPLSGNFIHLQKKWDVF